MLTRQNTLYKNYSWTAISPDDPRVSGQPDSTLLNRMEGYEVIYFANKFCELNKLATLPAHHKVETLLRTVVPSQIRSQREIRSWLETNWSRY